MKYSIFGESHGPAIGVVLEGVPSGLELDMGAIQKELDRRRPGQSALSTARKEADVPKILSGVFQGKTTGAPLCAVIENGDQQTRYATANQAIASISGKYIVASVYTLEDAVCIRLIQDVFRSNDTQAEWVEAYQKETGEGISFF